MLPRMQVRAVPVKRDFYGHFALPPRPAAISSGRAEDVASALDERRPSPPSINRDRCARAGMAEISGRRGEAGDP